MLKKVSYVFIINGLAVGCGLFKNILLARSISEKDFGLYSLLLTIIGFLYPISLLGLQTSLVRFLSGQDFKRFNFLKGLRNILILSAIIALVGALIASDIYLLPTPLLLFLIVVIVSSAINDLIAAVLRAQGLYNLSMFIFRGVNFFILVVLIVLYTSNQLNFDNALFGIAIIFAAFSIVTSTIASKHFGRGDESFPSSIWKDGMIFWGTDISLLVVVSIDRFLIPKMLSLEALGLYFAIFAMMRLFDLTFQSFEFVLLPYARRLKKYNLIWIAIAATTVGLSLTIVYLTLGSYVVDLVYKGKYTHGVYLIPYFCVMKLMRILYVIPYSIISGRLQDKRLYQLFYSNMTTMLLSIMLALIFISIWGLVGAVLAATVAWFVRAMAGFVILYFERQSVLASA